MSVSLLLGVVGAAPRYNRTEVESPEGSFEDLPVGAQLFFAVLFFVVFIIVTNKAVTSGDSRDWLIAYFVIEHMIKMFK